MKGEKKRKRKGKHKKLHVDGVYIIIYIDTTVLEVLHHTIKSDKLCGRFLISLRLFPTLKFKLWGCSHFTDLRLGQKKEDEA